MGFPSFNREKISVLLVELREDTNLSRAMMVQHSLIRISYQKTGWGINVFPFIGELEANNEISWFPTRLIIQRDIPRDIWTWQNIEGRVVWARELIVRSGKEQSLFLLYSKGFNWGASFLSPFWASHTHEKCPSISLFDTKSPSFQERKISFFYSTRVY